MRHNKIMGKASIYAAFKKLCFKDAEVEKIFLRPIESGFSDYIALDICKVNLDILGVVIESRLQYQLTDTQ